MRDYVGDGKSFGVEAEYSFDGPRLLGTAGALKPAVQLLGDAFFVTLRRFLPAVRLPGRGAVVPDGRQTGADDGFP